MKFQIFLYHVDHSTPADPVLTRTNVPTYDMMIYLLTAIGLPPGGSSTVHIYTKTISRTIQKKTIHRKTQQFWKSVGRAPSWLVIPWHLRYS